MDFERIEGLDSYSRLKQKKRMSEKMDTESPVHFNFSLVFFEASVLVCSIPKQILLVRSSRI
jgi:hypothetical protein